MFSSCLFGFLFIPHIQKHAGRWIGVAKLPICVNKCVAVYVHDDIN